MNPAECYFCTRHPRLGHHGGCPVLEMTPVRVVAFFGPGHSATPMPEADTLPDLPKVSKPATVSVPRGYIMGDGRLV